ncbi:MAG: hypothetical protein EOO45_20460 [Flavobacterium sp.]|nr:MAG: hypothetical protein EOO45_20460 [Flavobacterium sp.]
MRDKLSKCLLLALLFTAAICTSQTITGYVYDETKQPLEGAFVYLDGTTLSASTDAKGFFSIKAPQRLSTTLVVSFIGFETFRLQDPFKYEKALGIVLREDSTVLDEVVVTGKSGFTRKQMMKVFREEFLGKSKAGSSCKIENEQDITVYFDANTNTLFATASKPIRITNKRLAYNVQFDLMNFQVNYNYKTLDRFNMTGSFFAGTTFFKDVAVNASADKKRKEAYLGSVTHLLKTMSEESWETEKFELYTEGFISNPKEFFNVSDTLGFKMITLIKVPESKGNNLNVLRSKPEGEEQSKYSDYKFQILYDRKGKNEQSFFIFDKGFFYVDKNGQFFPVNELAFGGHMSTLKAGDMLPADFK